MTSFFRDQVSCVSEWFILWNECERAVALYSLLRKITLTQAKFLSQVLDHILKSCSDSDSQENLANDPAYINSLSKESKDSAVLQLLKCLPLLRVGNVKAKAEYLSIMPKIMAHSVENGCHIEECRQLLSYSLIHPAISRDELSILASWMNSLEEFGNGAGHSATPPNILSPPFDERSNEGFGNLAMVIPGLDKSSAFVQNGFPTRYLAKANSDRPCVVNSWSAVASGGNEKGDQFTVSKEPVHSSITRSRNQPLTSSASLPLTDDVSHQFHFSSREISTKTHPQQLSSLPYTALHKVQGVKKSEGHQKLTRTASLVPQPNVSSTPSISEWLGHGRAEHSEGTDLSGSSSGGRHNSLFAVNSGQPHHIPLSPQSSITSSGSGGSDVHQDDWHRTSSAGGAREDLAMKSVSVWLKSLRLHKYSNLFQQITYDEMMNLTEEWLEAQGVTKGARDKILISIQKLKDRPATLRTMEKDVMGNGNLKQAIGDLRQLLNAPLKRYSSDLGPLSSSAAGKDDRIVNCTADAGVSQAAKSSSDRMGAINESDSIADGDIPGQMTRVFGKICTQLLVKIRPDGDCLISYQHLLDHCINHHAFTEEQKKKMTSWRQQIHKVWQFLLQKHNMDYHRTSSGIQPNILNRGSHSRLDRRLTGPSWTFGSPVDGSRPLAQHQLGHLVLSSQASAPHCPNASSRASGYSSRLPVDVSPVKQPLSRTQSAPIKTIPLSMPPIVSSPVVETPENSSANEDIHASLDSLCISMMEHALGN